jgi:SAM-dependent methyltransferase
MTDERATAGGPDRTALARRKLLGILSASWTAQCVYAVVRLGVPDLLADGPRDARELARECGADPLTLSRVLRALTMLGLFASPGPGIYALTPTTELLRADVPGSVRLNALLQGDEVFRAFAEIMYTVRTGRPSFEKVHGEPFYDYLGSHPAASHNFHDSMGEEKAPDALATCDLSDARVIVDIGGGNGALLIEALAAAPATARGVLLELPDALRVAAEKLAEAGLADRVDLVPGSFFDQVPVGGDVYVLSRVLHNWTDEKASRVLARVRDAMTDGARLLVLEDLLPESGAPDATGRGAAAAMVDMLMLVTQEGSARTAAQFEELLVGAGFEVLAVRRASPTSTSGVLEATPARKVGEHRD